MTEEQIKEINDKCPEDQGIFKEPYGIPTHIKEPVIYLRWSAGGLTGGSYHEDSCLRPFEGEPKPNFEALDQVLKILKPNISYLDYKKVEKLIEDNEYDDDSDYYGNCENYYINYIILSRLEQLIKTL